MKFLSFLKHFNFPLQYILKMIIVYRETVVIGDNVSYVISSTGKVHAVEDPYYSSILSLAPREEFPPAPQQPLPPLPLTTTVRDEQEAEIKETETRDSEVKETEIEDGQIRETTCTVQENEDQTSEAKSQGSETQERVRETKESQSGETQSSEGQGSKAKETEINV